MRRGPVVLGVCSIVAWCATSYAAAPAPIFTRQTSFQIPYRLDEPARAGGVEVELNVSSDAGRNWRSHSRVAAGTKHFVFRAPSDGEYWFTVRTVSLPSTTPAGPLTPELRVIVDTQPPSLNFQVARGPTGELVAQWVISDLHLRADGLQLEYQVAATDAPWQAVAVDPIPLEATRVEFSGRAAWWPAPDPSSAFVVRCELTDLAGNVAVAEAPLAAATSAGTAPLGAPRTVFDGALPSAEQTAAAAAWPVDRVAEAPLAGNPGGEELLPPPPGRSAPEPAGTPGRLASRIGPPESIPLPAAAPHAPAVTGEEIASGAPSDWGGTDPRANAPDDEPAGASVETAAPHAGARDTVRHAPPVDQPAGFNLSQLPPGVEPQMVSTREFELDYEIESVGSSGIAKVELWGTTDGGQTWSSYGSDDDAQSPLVANVDGPGLYGFRLTVQSGSGLAGRPPAEGDTPDVWVGVDLSKPVARLLPWEHAFEGDAGVLTIRWEATDDWLADAPITLAYGLGPNGPWTVIASEIENSGAYAWKFDTDTPEQVYLRLEVVDFAGNLRIVESREPALLDRLRPTGKIRQIRPLRSRRD